MRYQNDLAILSAETYALDRQPGSPRGASIVNNASQASSPTPADGPRKRARLHQPVENGEPKGEEKKKGRGRPRLGIKDESAAERRRAQIRLAQRAYRSRKELAIQSLEKKVQDLKDTNEQMSNAFMKLHDFAVNQGLLHVAPDFGRELRQTTEKFLSLARQSSDENAKDDDQEQENGADHDSADGQEDGDVSPRVELQTSKSQKLGALDMSSATSAEGEKQQSPKMLYGGLIVSHELVAMSNDHTSALSTSLDTPAGPSRSPGYEVVTFPTPENASFPLGTGMAPDLSLPDFTIPSPYTPIGAPSSLSAHEITFGRRLQRRGLERALALITSPNAPPARLGRIFGFSGMVESRSAIERRLRAALTRNYEESLSYWQFPFPHVGGAGTHFSDESGTMATSLRPGQRIGNQGTTDVLKTRVSNGWSMGPFDANVQAVAERTLDQSFHITGVPGLQGDFFDSDEIELYLNHCGVSIPPGADFVTAVIDPAQFDYPNTGTSALEGSGGFSMPGAIRPHSALAGVHGLDSNNMHREPPLFSSLSFSSGETRATGPTIPSVDKSGNITWESDVLFGGAFPGMGSNQFLAATPSAVGSGGDGGGGFGLGSSASSSSDLLGSTDIGAISHSSGHGARTSTSRRTVSVDVDLLVCELLNRCSCLGRTLGVRRVDVNTAFRTAASPLHE